jgi:hypothetical protein
MVGRNQIVQEQVCIACLLLKQNSFIIKWRWAKHPHLCLYATVLSLKVRYNKEKEFAYQLDLVTPGNKHL